MTAAHRAHLEWSPQRMLGFGRDIVPNTNRIADHQLASKPHPEMRLPRVLGVAAAARQYGRERWSGVLQGGGIGRTHHTVIALKGESRRKNLAGTTSTESFVAD